MFYEPRYDSSSYRLHLLTGLGAGLAWLRLLPLIEHFGETYSALLGTLRRSLPFLTKVPSSLTLSFDIALHHGTLDSQLAIGGAPLFLGFTFFGMSLFGSKSRLFSSTGMIRMPD